MKLRDLSIRNTAPIALFDVSDLSDVVVLAGPNGVGKTRLIQRVLEHLRGAQRNPEIAGSIEATCQAERDAWGKSLLDMSSDEDMSAFRLTLQVARRRQNWSSSLL
jgi:predicted ATPase